MRIYYDIDLDTRKIDRRELHGEAIVRAGRYLIARTLLERGAARPVERQHADPERARAGHDPAAPVDHLHEQAATLERAAPGHQVRARRRQPRDVGGPRAQRLVQ